MGKSVHHRDHGEHREKQKSFSGPCALCGETISFTSDRTSYLHRVHSTHDNNDWLEEAFPQRVFINPIDAERHGIRDGDPVKVFNERGALILPCRLTVRIMPGVIDIPQGAWFDPDENGVDRGGCVNVLTSQRWTPFAFATAQHTIMVEVERTVDGRRWTVLDGLRSMVNGRNLK